MHMMWPSFEALMSCWAWLTGQGIPALAARLLARSKRMLWLQILSVTRYCATACMRTAPLAIRDSQSEPISKIMMPSTVAPCRWHISLLDVAVLTSFQRSSIVQETSFCFDPDLDYTLMKQVMAVSFMTAVFAIWSTTGQYKKWTACLPKDCLGMTSDLLGPPLLEFWNSSFAAIYVWMFSWVLLVARANHFIVKSN